MADDLSVFMTFYYLLGAETLKPAVPMLLKLGRATGADLETIAILDSDAAEIRRKKAEAA